MVGVAVGVNDEADRCLAALAYFLAHPRAVLGQPWVYDCHTLVRENERCVAQKAWQAPNAGRYLRRLARRAA